MLIKLVNSFPLDLTPYLDEVDENFQFINSFHSLEDARQGTRGINNVIYIIQKKLFPSGRILIYVGETINDLAKRYGQITSGLGDVIEDKWDSTNINVDVYQMDYKVDKLDEKVIRLIRNDMIGGDADANIRIRNRRGLMKGMNKRERENFKKINNKTLLQIFEKVKKRRRKRGIISENNYIIVEENTFKVAEKWLSPTSK